MRGAFALFLSLIASLASAYAGFTDATLELRRELRREGPEWAIATANRRLAGADGQIPAVAAELWEIKALAIGQAAGQFPIEPTDPGADNDVFLTLLRDRVLAPYGRLIADAWKQAATHRRQAGDGLWAGRDAFLAEMAVEPFAVRPTHGPGSNDHQGIDRAVQEVLDSRATARQKATVLLQMAYPMACNQRKAALARKIILSASQLSSDDASLRFASGLNLQGLRLFVSEDDSPVEDTMSENLPDELLRIQFVNALTSDRVRQVSACVRAVRGDKGGFAQLADVFAVLRSSLAEYTDEQLRLYTGTDFLSRVMNSDEKAVYETSFLYALPILGDLAGMAPQFVPLSLSTGMTALVRNRSLESALRDGFGAYPIAHHGAVFDYSHALAAAFGAYRMTTPKAGEIDLLTRTKHPIAGMSVPLFQAEADSALASGTTGRGHLPEAEIPTYRERWASLPDVRSGKHLYEYARLTTALLDSEQAETVGKVLQKYDSSFDVSAEGSTVWESLVRIQDDGGLFNASATFDFRGSGAIVPWILSLDRGLVAETSDLVTREESRRPMPAEDALVIGERRAEDVLSMSEHLAAAPWRVMTGPLGRSVLERREFAAKQANAFRLAARARSAAILASIDLAAAQHALLSGTDPSEIKATVERARSSGTASVSQDAAMPLESALDYIFRDGAAATVLTAIQSDESEMSDRRDEAMLVARALVESSLPPVVRTDSLAEVLDPEEALVAYLVGDERIAVIVARVQGGRPTFAQVRVDRSAVEGPVLAWVDALANARTVDSGQAAEVARLLLPEPILDAIGDAKTLYVMPQSFLWRVPFGALPVGQERLYERHSLGYVESLSLHRQIRSTSGRHGNGGLLGVGGVDFGQIEAGTIVDPTGLAALKLSAGQVGAIAEAIRQDALPTSSESAVKAALRSARIAHFATHGVVPPAPGDQIWSALLLEPWDGEDGLLQPAEIFGAGPFLSLDLVTLVACQSGATQDSMGPFNRAFLYSGAQTVVSTHWSIGEEVGDLFTRSLYAELAKGATSFQAMRTAIDAVRREFPDEHDWAPYALYGLGTNRPVGRSR